jgi:crotonobetaine/carnitine-CoA ligase
VGVPDADPANRRHPLGRAGVPGAADAGPPAATLRADGWLRTGDLGSLDEAGFVHFHSRKKDMLKPKGENVAASEIEQVLELHTAVVEAAVVGVFGPHHEERVVAVVAGEECGEEELIGHCAEHLARFKVPSEVVWVAELPKTSIGKINKGEVRAMLGQSQQTNLDACSRTGNKRERGG